MARFAERDDPAALTAQEIIDQLGSYVAARYQVAESTLLEQIARRAAADLDTDSQARRLAAVRRLQAEAERIMAAVATEVDARRIVNIALAEGTAAAVEQIGLAAAAAGSTTTAVLNGQELPFATGLTPAAATAAAQIGLELSNALADVRERIIRATPDAYQRIIAESAGERLLGVTTGRQSRRIGLERLLDEGLTAFVGRDGRRWRVGSYTEMATRTATNRAWIAAHVTKWQSIGVNLVSIVRGVDSCRACAAWAGRVLSTDGTPAGEVNLEHATTGEPVTITVAGTLDDARAGGWNHPNCRCTLAPVFPGLSLPADDTTYDPQQEADRDRLRYLERRTRDFKRRERLARAAGDDVAAQRWRRAALDEQGRIREHVAATGQLRKPYREALSFADGAPRDLPPTPPTAIVPDLPDLPDAPAAATPRATPASDVPEWLQEHRAIADRMPARDRIGYTTRTVTGEEQLREELDALEARVLGMPRAQAVTQLDAMRERSRQISELADLYRTRGDELTGRAWPADIRPLADALGIGRRQPRSFSSIGLDNQAREQAGLAAFRAKRLQEVDSLSESLRRQKWTTVTRQVPDVTETGALGQITEQALDDVLRAGRLVDDEIERRLRTLPGAPDNVADDVLEAARVKFYRLQTEWGKAMTSGQTTAAGRLADELDDARNAYRDLLARRQAFDRFTAERRRQVTLDVLGETRPYGGGGRSDYFVTSGPVDDMVAAMERAHESYPTAWNDLAESAFPEVTVLAESRGYNSMGTKIALSFNPNRGGYNAVATHELGHSMERAVPGVRALEWAWHYRRSDKITDAAGAVRPVPPRALGSGYGLGEVHVPDQWAENYTGKVYLDAAGQYGPASSYEVLTTGMEGLLEGDRYFRWDDDALDYEYRRWLLGVLSIV